MSLILYNTSTHKAVVLKALDYVPLCLFTLLAQSCPAVYKLYSYSTWTLSLSFRSNQDFWTIKSKELHKSFDFPVYLLSAAA